MCKLTADVLGIDEKDVAVASTGVIGGICASEGFLANGVHAGIKKNSEKKDLAIIYSKTLCSAAAVYTYLLSTSAAVAVGKGLLHDGNPKAVICNSGNANTCNKV